jgi:hypothetical protein
MGPGEVSAGLQNDDRICSLGHLLAR